MALKVLMVGGRRCGKTSALASTFDRIINGPVKDFFTVADRTSYTDKITSSGTTGMQDVLGDKKLELEYLLEEPSQNFFLVDASPTDCKWVYNLRLMLPGAPSKAMDIEFTDVPGEWFTPGAGNKIDTETGRPVREVIAELIAESDVFVVMVDTPNLMYDKPSIAAASNAIGGIGDYLTNLQCDAKNEKLVIFSPIKCEKWVKEGRMDEVISRMESMYETMLTALKAYAGMNICVIPIETAGNILFFEHSDPTILAGNPPRKCKKETDCFVRLADGSMYPLSDTDVINPDPEALITGQLMRPYSWFHINPDVTGKKLYRPVNCEQIPLHIIQFMLNKMNRKKQDGGIITMLLDFIFGSISLGDLNSKLDHMRRAGVIKNNVDHIRYIKSTFQL